MSYKIAIGVPSYNEAKYVRFVLRQVDAGIKKYFDPKECLILNLDSYSTDGTKEIFLSTKTVTEKKSVTTPSGKGRAMLHFFKFCIKNNIPYCATVDADLKSIKPNWVYSLIHPLEVGFDYTIPVYTRNRFESNITNHFAYPLLYSAYPIGLRQPLGGEFGYSKRFCQYLLQQPKQLKTFQYGIDIFISCNAIAGGYNIKEVYLGKKIHKPSFYHMEPTFRQVFESGVFVSRLHRHKKISLGKISLSSKSSGIDKYKCFPHKGVIEKLLKQLKVRFLRYKKLGCYNFYLGNDLLKKVEKIVQKGKPNLSGDLWTDILAKVLKKCYENNFKVNKLSTVSRMLIPIYRWRAASCWLEIENMDTNQAEKVIRREAARLRNNLKKYSK